MPDAGPEDRSRVGDDDARSPHRAGRSPSAVPAAAANLNAAPLPYLVFRRQSRGASLRERTIDRSPGLSNDGHLRREDDSKPIYGSFQPRLGTSEMWCFCAGWPPGLGAGYHFQFVVRGRFLRLIWGSGSSRVCACVLWLRAGGIAAGSPQDSGVYDQYTEQIPTAGGSHHSGTTGGPGAGGPVDPGPTGSIVLPANLNKDGGKDAKTLREVATSPRYGAPTPGGPLSGELRELARSRFGRASARSPTEATAAWSASSSRFSRSPRSRWDSPRPAAAASSAGSTPAGRAA